VYLARQETKRALLTLEGLEEQAESAGRLAQAIEIWLLKALAQQAQGDSAVALESFERVLSWAEPEDYVRLFLETGTDVIPLLRRAASNSIRPRYTGQLLAAFEVEEKENAPASPLFDSQALLQPLTQRELEVLRPNL
jgi:LuxR family maltose regulon positive regulatory protein